MLSFNLYALDWKTFHGVTSVLIGFLWITWFNIFIYFNILSITYLWTEVPRYHPTWSPSLYMLEILPSMRPTPSCLIAAFGLPSSQPPTRSLCWVWRGRFSPTLLRDITRVVFIKRDTHHLTSWFCNPTQNSKSILHCFPFFSSFLPNCWDNICQSYYGLHNDGTILTCRIYCMWEMPRHQIVLEEFNT